LTKDIINVYDEYRENLAMNLKKGIHHIRHSRPKWYQDYHQWEHHATLHWITFIISCVVIMMGFVNVVTNMQAPIRKTYAATSSTNVNQDVTSGVLSISNTGDQYLSTASASVTNQNTTGSLGTITVTDNRGSGVGWSATATSTQFYKYNSPVMTGGSNNTLSIGTGSTPYASTSADTYTITITGGGGAGVATYNAVGLGGDTSSGTTGTNVAIGTRGLKVTFGAATYTMSDSWTIRVDMIPVTGFQVTPGTLTTISGSAANVTAGSQHTFSSTVDATALITASSGYGLGSYSVTPSLQLTVPGSSFANTYQATVTETVL